MDIKLAHDTIERYELEALSAWILNGNRLTKGDETLCFEREFANYSGIKHAIFTNSGSSSNLLMIYGLEQAGYLKNKKVIAPSVSWVTTVSPLIQFGFDVSLCECDQTNLGLDIKHLEELLEKERPALVILVHVLGHANHISEIKDLCNAYDAILIEDSCEALGSIFNGKKLGTLSKAGSYSFYYGHHISTIEGGMVVTDDTKLYQIMLSLRSHGWSRDLAVTEMRRLQSEYNIDKFRNYYTFYYPGFNLRSTDLQAKIGRTQIKKLDAISDIRQRNFYKYKENLPDFYCQNSNVDLISSFAFGTFVENRMQVFEKLSKEGIECRPLICGNIGRHPFWLKKFDDPKLANADLVHDYGMYLPNHANLSANQVEFVCDTFQSVAIPKQF